MKNLKVLPILLIAFALSACGKQVEQPIKIEPEHIQEETENSLIQESPKPENTIYRDDMKPEISDLLYRSNMEKSAIFLDRTYKETKENTIVSPLSLNFAISMVAEGASGETKELLNSYLNSNDYGNYVNEYMKYTEALNKEYETYEGKYKNVFEIANSIWVNDAVIKPDYEKKTTNIYKAKIDSFDGSDSIGSAKKINSWVEEKTHKMIPEIVKPIMINSDTRSILVNTIYFESAWAESWNYFEDYKKEFTDIDGNVKEIAYMTGEANQYFENDKATAFSYSYKNGLSFIGILPKTEGEFEISDLNIEELLENQIEATKINVEMPRLNFETEVNGIKDMMIDIGMEQIFSDEAEFDEILEGSVLHIDNIIQKCKLELDENGTKASAVTAIIMYDNAMLIDESNIKEVTLNRPFAFLIYDSEMNQIVFIGKVVKV